MSLANYETNIMKLSQSNDAGLEVAIMGKQETDKAVVLLHGAIMNYKIMTIFAKYIHDVKLIFINCPGRGKVRVLNAKIMTFLNMRNELTKRLSLLLRLLTFQKCP